jgi:putative nucleotidyltransferase with HDIG domain
VQGVRLKNGASRADEQPVRVPRQSFSLWVNGALLAAAVVAAGLCVPASTWGEPGVLAALVLLGLGSDMLAIHVRGLHLSANLAAIALALALLGPTPAVIVALAPIVVDWARRRPSVADLVSNLATFTTFPLVGAGLIALTGFADLPDIEACGLLLVVFMAVNAVNFLLIYAHRVMEHGWSWRTGMREMYLPVVPAQLGIGLLTSVVVYVERRTGPEAIMVLAPVVIICQWLLRTAMAAFERGVEVDERNRQLAALQFGLISSMLKTLSLRDNMTARHSAAVARYAREMASELGVSEVEQELIHTAALFHDIGKFIFPDSILLSTNRLTEEEYDIVRRHPEVGAEVISEIEGYGPVAEIVLHHHGYPHGLHGDQIPLGARIIAVADVYDVITARDTYRTPVTMSEAFTELRRSAGTQLDAELVETFIDLMLRKGVVFHHSTPADFEAELALERRVSDYAAPRRAA